MIVKLIKVWPEIREKDFSKLVGSVMSNME